MLATLLQQGTPFLRPEVDFHAFAPEIVLPALEHVSATYPEITSELGLKCSFNPSYTVGTPRTSTGMFRSRTMRLTRASCW